MVDHENDPTHGGDSTSNGERAISRDSILRLAKERPLDIDKIDTPELDGYLLVKEMTAKERDAWEEWAVKNKGGRQRVSVENLRAKLFVRVVVNPDGSRMFSDNEIKLVGDLPSAVVDRVFGFAMKKNRISDDDIEEMVGNSESARHTA